LGGNNSEVLRAGLRTGEGEGIKKMRKELLRNTMEKKYESD